MVFIPISLKKKTVSELMKELREKGVNTVIDVRRMPVNAFNSARWFFTKKLYLDLAVNHIVYIRQPQFSNINCNTYASQFLTDKLRKRLRKYFIDKPPMKFGKVGFVCYCTENLQQSDDCHASWICNFLNNPNTSCWHCEYNDEYNHKCEWGEERYKNGCKYYTSNTKKHPTFEEIINESERTK